MNKRPKKNSSEEFTTSDKNLVAYLHSQGFDWHSTQLYGNTVYFSFLISDNLLKFIDGYPTTREKHFADSLNKVWEEIQNKRKEND